MENERGGRDVIARAISSRMKVPILDALRDVLEQSEYLEILELARVIVESSRSSTLPSWQIGMAFAAAAAMYAEALEQGAALMGRGPGEN